MQDIFQKQNDELLTNIINALCQTCLPDTAGFERFKDSAGHIELYITPECNQKCTYCYLQKHMEDLYPKEIRDKEQILKNIELLLNYFIESNFNLTRLDLFSGEIWGYPYSLKIFDIILAAIDRGLQVNCVSIPTNGSFCFSKNLIKILESYIAKFDRRNVRLSFSLSYDGPLLDNEARPINGQKIEKNEEFLTNMVNFAKRNNYGFHPMIDASTIEKQIDNYKAWIDIIYKYYHPKDMLTYYGLIMQLEVRDGKWTEDKIISYLKWLKFLIDTDINEFFHNNVNDFIQVPLTRNLTLQDLQKQRGCETSGTWEPYFPYIPYYQGGRLGCALGTTLIIRAGDLAICPCHRTSYPKFILGHFTTNEDRSKITGITSHNVPLASGIYVTGFKTKPKCTTCPITNVCTRYCIGANFETNNDLFAPIEENCELQKAKIIFMYIYYKTMDITLPPLEECYKRLKQEEPEVLNKWTTIIQSII